ncbi:MAG: insulinase family protein [Acidobacteriota bacterium]|nr:insulinase family protein [Acidobacteriota bacterium]
MSFRSCLVLCGLLAVAAGAAHAAPPTGQATAEVFPYPVHQTRLDNGLEVIVIPYDSPGTVAYYTIVRTGARDEVEPGHSGFAHFFEHMMFRGTEKYPQAKYTDILKEMGADSNASTADDVTKYHIVGPAAELETMIDMESDRFKNLKYTEEGFRTESLAVLGEYNKSVANPFQVLYEKVRNLAFERHTYKHTAMGFISDIKAMPGYYRYSIDFWNRFYRPENCIVVVIGDADPQKVFALAKRYYGDWKPGYKAPSVVAEPPQTAEKKDHVDWPNPVHPQFFAAYHAPAFATTSVDSAAADLIGQLLFSESSPLAQELLVDKQWVDFLNGGVQNSRDPYLFTVVGQVKSEELLPKVLATIDRAIALLAAQPVDAARLERTKSHQRYSFALGLTTPGGIAEQVGDYLALTGDVRSINRYFDAYRQVTPADIQRVARQIFRRENHTIVTLSHPADPAVKGEAPGSKGSRGGDSHE